MDPGGQKFHQITLSGTVSEINAFSHFIHKFKMATKIGRKNDFLQKVPDDSTDSKICQNCSILHRFGDSKVFHFTLLRKIVAFSQLLDILYQDHFRKVMISRHLSNKPTRTISCE